MILSSLDMDRVCAWSCVCMVMCRCIVLCVCGHICEGTWLHVHVEIIEFLRNHSYVFWGKVSTGTQGLQNKLNWLVKELQEFLFLHLTKTGIIRMGHHACLFTCMLGAMSWLSPDLQACVTNSSWPRHLLSTLIDLHFVSEKQTLELKQILKCFSVFWSLVKFLSSLKSFLTITAGLYRYWCLPVFSTIMGSKHIATVNHICGSNLDWNFQEKQSQKKYWGGQKYIYKLH